MPNLNLITAPTTAPVSLQNMRLYLKVDDDVTDDDGLISSLIDQAKEVVEKYCRRRLFTQTWEIVFSHGPKTFELPFGQLQSITSIKVKAEDGTESTQSSDNYMVDAGDTGRVTLKTGNVWTTTTRPYNNFTVRFVCGWDDVDDIPPAYLTAIKKIVATMYENREARNMSHSFQHSGIDDVLSDAGLDRFWRL